MCTIVHHSRFIRTVKDRQNIGHQRVIGNDEPNINMIIFNYMIRRCLMFRSLVEDCRGFERGCPASDSAHSLSWILFDDAPLAPSPLLPTAARRLHTRPYPPPLCSALPRTHRRRICPRHHDTRRTRRPARPRRSTHSTNRRRKSVGACSGMLTPHHGKPFQISKTHFQQVTSR